MTFLPSLEKKKYRQPIPLPSLEKKNQTRYYQCKRNFKIDFKKAYPSGLKKITDFPEKLQELL